MFCLALTENDKSDDQEWATDQQKAGRGPGESLLEPTGHSHYRRAGVRGGGRGARERRAAEEMNMK
jgi:hypothetical protein